MYVRKRKALLMYTQYIHKDLLTLNTSKYIYVNI